MILIFKGNFQKKINYLIKLTVLTSSIVFQSAGFASDFPILKLGKENKFIFLIGAYHVAIKKIENDERLNSIIHHSKAICFESDPEDVRNNEITRETILLSPKGVLLSDKLGKVLYEKIKNKLNIDAGSTKYINIYSPFSAGAQLLNLNPGVQEINRKFQTTYAFENYIQSIVSGKISIDGFEDKDALVNSFLKISNEDWQQYLSGLLEMVECQQCIDNYVKYLNQSYTPSRNPQDAFENQMKAFGNSSNVAKIFDQLFYGERNIAMVQSIEKKAFQENKCDLLVVGAGHLGGKNGLINLFKERGFSVDAN